MANTAFVLWTGGKDSSLALYEAKLLGYDVKGLVTFVPPQPKFLAHPLHLIKYQAETLGLPHTILEVNEPFKVNYENALRFLKEKKGIDQFVTGDIAEVDGYPNWIKECSRSAGAHVLTPLWGIDRVELIQRLFACKFQVVFSCIKKPWFTREWVGRELNENSLVELMALNRETGLDICGEQGEYHTMVLDGPLFRKKICIDAYSKKEDGALMYMNIQKVSLKDKSR